MLREGTMAWMHRLLVPLLATTATAQFGRTLQVVVPPILGQTAQFSLSYPMSAVGNLYWLLWSTPQFPGTTIVQLPGFTVQGVALVDPVNFAAPFAGLFAQSGSVSQTVAIPNNPALVGYAWDLQSIDLGVITSVLTFSDNELALTIPGNPPPNLVPIAAGTFSMGSTFFPSGNETPVHTVTISRPFWIGAHEVTQSDYQALMGTNPSQFIGGNRPVERVTWTDAVAYCFALTVQEVAAGRVPVGYQYRLPTEAEWEYCCRAGTNTEWYTGVTLACSDANFYTTAGYCYAAQTAPVGTYAPNPWGLFDMHGNVLEWCLDSWDQTSNYPASTVVDPYVGSGSLRIVRGGCWNNFRNDCRSAKRRGELPTFSLNRLGFRVVLAAITP